MGLVAKIVQAADAVDKILGSGIGAEVIELLKGKFQKDLTAEQTEELDKHYAEYVRRAEESRQQSGA